MLTAGTLPGTSSVMNDPLQHPSRALLPISHNIKIIHYPADNDREITVHYKINGIGTKDGDRIGWFINELVTYNLNVGQLRP